MFITIANHPMSRRRLHTSRGRWRWRWGTQFLGQTCARSKRKIVRLDAALLFRHLLSPQACAATAVGILGNNIGLGNGPLVGGMTALLRFVSGPLVLALIFIPELVERSAGEEEWRSNGDASADTWRLVLYGELRSVPAKLYANDPPSLRPPPKINPQISSIKQR
jgi:hypothetical protein